MINARSDGASSTTTIAQRHAVILDYDEMHYFQSIARRQSDLLLPDNDRSYGQDDCTEDCEDDTCNQSNKQLINLPV